ncbi:hypothetical protein OV203_21065 [Nannocystis sp. ILAH1]|uniref:hypothetical protein n=1 Tax=unclassified Nannocystis TaxID=2627009 RepID=UPI00226D63D0|nr:MULTISPECIES: hypothetical protein [unclassified Nannocystis]MCY0989642.1 hypothetical protein [Nannocystis sp. ILAH1]MCY1071258.1 hypothetical protein [Nannocystis sp. RBIL2]
MDDRLGTLTDLLQQTPSEALWTALCEELAQWEPKALAQVALPRVQEQLERWPDEVERWADAGPLVTVQRVAGAAALKKLAQAGQPVRWLELRLSAVGERAVPGIVASLQALQPYGLSLEVEEVDDGNGVAPLAELDAPRLRVLTIEAPGLGDAAAENIADNPKLTGLMRLSLAGSGLTSAGAKALAKGAHLASLTALDLANNKPGDAGLRALLQSPHLGRLTKLSLAGCGLGPKAAQVLAQSSAVARLTTLELADNRLTAAGRAALAASPHLGEAVKRALPD